MRRIKKGDKVQVISGKDKGRIGTVLSISMTTKGTQSELWALVEGINLIKKHVRANPNKQIAGGIITRESRIRACKLALHDPASNKPSRVGIRVLANGDKVRYFKSSNEVVDV